LRPPLCRQPFWWLAGRRACRFRGSRTKAVVIERDVPPLSLCASKPIGKSLRSTALSCDLDRVASTVSCRMGWLTVLVVRSATLRGVFVRIVALHLIFAHFAFVRRIHVLSILLNTATTVTCPCLLTVKLGSRAGLRWHDHKIVSR
jgi:hypothetical protein